MKIRKYIGHSLQDAMVQMKRELGEGAIVLSTRTVQRPDATYIEITAGIDEPLPSRPPQLNPEIQKYVERLVEDFRATHTPPAGATEETPLVSRSSIPDVPLPPYPDLLLHLWQIFFEDGYPASLLAPLFKHHLSQLLKLSSAQALSFLLGTILEGCIFANAATLLQREQRHRIVFIGPSGCGKSSLIAKLTAWFAEHQQPVQLATTDAYKVDGATLLEITAQLFQIPYHKFYTAQEIHQFLTTNALNTSLLIDTPGWNITEAAHRRELLSFLEALQPTLTVLVLPAYFSSQHLAAVLAAFECCNPTHYALTKLDETSSWGAILSTCYQRKLPLLFCSTGSEIPEDLRIANRDLLFTYAQHSLEVRMKNIALHNEEAQL